MSAEYVPVRRLRILEATPSATCGAYIFTLSEDCELWRQVRHQLARGNVVEIRQELMRLSDYDSLESVEESP